MTDQPSTRWAETVDTDDGGATIRIPAYAPDGSETDGLLLTRADAVMLRDMLTGILEDDSRSWDAPTPAGTDGLRDRIAGAIYEKGNPGYRWEDAHPHDRIAFVQDADAALAVLRERS